MTPPSIDEFLAAAREFCSFAEEDSPIIPDDLWRIRQWLLRLLYHAPAIENATHAADHPGTRPDRATHIRIARRFGELPFDLYRVVFDPHNLDATDEPVMGLLSNDLADIYCDLAEGLSNAERGYIDDACFDWCDSYRIHWARHATYALMAIEIWRTDNYQRIE